MTILFLSPFERTLVASASTAFVPAVLVTMALFCLMHYMIMADGQRVAEIGEVGDYSFIEFVHLQQDPNESRIVPSRPALPQKPSPPMGSPPSPKLTPADAPIPVLPQLKAAMPEPGPMELGSRSLLELYAVAGNEAKVPLLEPTVAQNMPTDRPVRQQRGGRTTAMAGSRVTSPGEASADGRNAATGGVLLGANSGAGDFDGEVTPLVKLEPRYPRKAAMTGQEGWVKVEFTITERGTVIEANVVASRPHRIFDRAALRAIRQWRFRPKIVDLKPVQRRATQIIEFKLAET